MPLKAAVVIGPTPNLIYAAASTFPYGVDEYAVAGAIAGKPLELVRCRTADIYVPAHAEMILEGEISPDEMDHNWPFGEFSGYMAGRGKYPRFIVKHITQRENPILLDLVAAHPPCEGSKLKQIATEAIFYHGLKENVGMSGIKAGGDSRRKRRLGAFRHPAQSAPTRPRLASIEFRRQLDAGTSAKYSSSSTKTSIRTIWTRSCGRWFFASNRIAIFKP